MIVVERPAPARLAGVVKSFGERRADLGTDEITALLPARPDQFIEFYLADPYQVSLDNGQTTSAPKGVVVGPQSYGRTRLTLSGSVHAFTIRFQPAGFHALFGIPMKTLVNEGACLADVIGKAGVTLRDAVLRAGDFDARVFAVQSWLEQRLTPEMGNDPIACSAAMLQRSGGRMSIRSVAHQAALSDRQFTRRFERQVGLTPKLFARTVRLNRVFDAKSRAPCASWTDLAHDAGYADQAHLIRDCRALTGSAPADFLRQWAPAR